VNRAAVLWGAHQLTIEEIVFDEPSTFEVLVQVAASGLCHSDYHFIDGTLSSRFPRILGHEVSGTVEKVGDGVTEFAVGDHVVACFGASCGGCASCNAGRPQLCLRRASYWSRPLAERPRVTTKGQAIDQGSGIGGLADHIVVHEKALVKIRPEMPLLPAAILGCAVLTGTGAVFRTANATAGSRVSVIGCGAVGISIIQAARIVGCSQVIAVDRIAAKLHEALRFGATDVVNASEGDAVTAIEDLTNGEGVDFAFEAIGSTATVEQAIRMTGLGGETIVVGIFSGDAKLTISPRDLVVAEKVLRGSYLGSSDFRSEIPRLVDLYLEGTLLLDEMLSPRIRLEQVAQGFEIMARGEALRPLVEFGTA